MEEKVVLVDLNDCSVGEIEKLEAHQKGLLHRAVSVFVFNSEKKMLLQKRAETKYHSPGLWTNTACTHPYMNESNEEAVLRRLKQEMGIEMDKVTKLFHFTYRETLENALIEHEFDHVYIGFSDDKPVPEPSEVSDFNYLDVNEVLEHVKRKPHEYTVWFKKIIDRVATDFYKYLTCIVMLSVLCSCMTATKEFSAVTPFDKEQYLGKWYEIARFDFRFEKGLNNTTAEYSLNTDGSIKVLNKGFDYTLKKWTEANGKAKFVGDEQVGKLKVSFFGPFYAGYNVLALDKDYSYALVSGSSLKYLWLLSREKVMPEDVKKRFIDKAKELGFDTSNLVWVEHDGL